MTDPQSRTLAATPQPIHEAHSRIVEGGQGRAQVVHHGIRENVRTSMTPQGTLVELGDEQKTRVIHSSPPAGSFLNPAAAVPAPAVTAAVELAAAKARHTMLLKQAASIRAEGKQLDKRIEELTDIVAEEEGDAAELLDIHAERAQLKREREELDAAALHQDELSAARAALEAERAAFEAEKAAAQDTPPPAGSGKGKRGGR